MRRWQSKGFTLVEVLVAISICGILTVLAVPGMMEMNHAFRRLEAKRAVRGDLAYLRSLALKEGGRAALTPAAGGYKLTLGYSPFSSYPGTSQDVLTRSLPQGVSLSTSDSIVFDSQGRLINASGAISSASVSLEMEGASFETVLIYPIGVVW